MTDDQALRDAYLQTTYRVAATAEPVDIRIGDHNPALDRLLQANGVHQWAFVTASNPQSQPLSDADNAQRNEEMKKSLHAAGWRTVDGVGLPGQPGWQAEHSVLILGIGREAACALSRRWQQKAIIYGALGKVPELVWID